MDNCPERRVAYRGIESIRETATRGACHADAAVARLGSRTRKKPVLAHAFCVVITAYLVRGFLRAALRRKARLSRRRRFVQIVRR
jgi:hypothetical protein